MTPENALQNAITALLLAAPAVVGIVGDKIFDEVPSDRPQDTDIRPPWIYLGPIARRRMETGCDWTWTITTRLYAASTGFGRRQAWELGSAMSDAIEGQSPELAGPYVLVEVLRCTQAGDVIEPPSPKTVYVDVTAVISRAN